jgi:beta-mannosidase
MNAQSRVVSLADLKWQFRQAGQDKWYPASIPGTVHTDLLANKLIPDPFLGNNESLVQWVENEDWEYQTTIDLTTTDLQSEQTELVFEGLDTYASLWINECLVFKADNMFRTWKVDVKSFFKPGINTFLIKFESAVKLGKLAASKSTIPYPGDERLFTRKAQYQYGWDWGPRLVTCGIWKPVNLIFWDKAKIENITYDQKLLNDSLVGLTFLIEVNANQMLNYIEFIINVDSLNSPHNLLIIKTSLFPGSNKVKADVLLKKPRKWWCNGMGEAYLYPFSIKLFHGYHDLDARQINIGIRTIELVQTPDSAGSSFYFKINNKPVFIKGANVIPPDNFLPRVKSKTYLNLVTTAVESNMNMLRIWGGGVYGDDKLYQYCDSLGIMVWQDFMFACAMYPEESMLSDNVRAEVKDQINRLQLHPSLALWCGNNEINEGWFNWGWQKQYKYSQKDSATIYQNYLSWFENWLPFHVKTFDPLRSSNYWPSSPSLGWGRKESYTRGDVHYWGVWWGMKPFETYNSKVGRFVSEYGFQGMPALNTFRKFAHDSDLNLQSKVVLNHQKHPTGYQTIQTYLERDFKTPKLFENYIYTSQILQAEGLKTAIEALRRAQPYCMGTLYWQLNDCWPVTSWSSIDYYNNWKASQYQVKRSYASKLLSIYAHDSAIEIYFVNDQQKADSGTLSLTLLNFDGAAIWQKRDWVTNSGSSSSRIYTLLTYELPQFNTATHVLKVEYSCKGNTNLPLQTLHYFTKPKDLVLKQPTFSITKAGPNKIYVETNTLARFVSLSFKNNQFKPSDNFFDVLPGEKKLVELKGKGQFENAKEAVTIISLGDSLE